MEISSKIKTGYDWIEITVVEGNASLHVDVHECEYYDKFLEFLDVAMDCQNERSTVDTVMDIIDRHCTESHREELAKILMEDE